MSDEAHSQRRQAAEILGAPFLPGEVIDELHAFDDLVPARRVADIVRVAVPRIAWRYALSQQSSGGAVAHMFIRTDDMVTFMIGLTRHEYPAAIISTTEFVPLASLGASTGIGAISASIGIGAGSAYQTRQDVAALRVRVRHVLGLNFLGL